MNWSKRLKLENYTLHLVMALLMLRALLMFAVPLLDKTEARYAEIARLMVESKDWVTLQIDYGVPFWGKPPLSTWLSASSMNWFGINELAVRLPTFVLLLILLFFLCSRLKTKGQNFFLPALILLTTPEFFLHTGVVSTDTCLTFCITMALFSFWEAMQTHASWYWKYLIFLFLGFGLLAKGPIALVLSIPVILIWSYMQGHNIINVMRKINVIKGIGILIVIATPWYALAEIQSPGFLNYFVLGEHFYRFFDPGWQGDLYGIPKTYPPGMIWVFLIIFGFPWIFLVLGHFWKNYKLLIRDPWTSFLIVWMLWPLLFFTLSRNILHTYLLPSVVPMALLVVHIWMQKRPTKIYRVYGGVFFIVVVMTSLIFLVDKDFKSFFRTDKYLIRKIIEESPDKPQLLCWEFKSYSSRFYWKAPVVMVQDSTELLLQLDPSKETYILVPQKFSKVFHDSQKKPPKRIASHKKTLLYLIEPHYQEKAHN